MNDSQYQRFFDLVCELSPENLTCDGELSHHQVSMKLSMLRREWKDIEAEVGREVSEDEIWDMHSRGYGRGISRF